MTVPYSFGSATSAIPLSQLDSNFNTPITLGNTAIQLGNTVTTLNNMTLANVTISSGSITIPYATANAVVYTNSSNVATTGSALTFDGSTLAVTAASAAVAASFTRTSTGVSSYILNGGATANFTSDTSANNSFALLPASNAATIVTAGSERARIDSSGNLGLGVTPSAWATLKAVQVGNAGFAGYNGGNYASANAYYDGASWRYITANKATLYQQGSGGYDGTHKWFVSSSTPSAGGDTSFTQAMTLDASGNLLINATTTAGNGNFTNAAGTSAALAATGTARAWTQINKVTASNNATVDVWLGRDAANNVFGNSFLVGHFYVYVNGASGANGFAGVYSIVSCGNGTSNATLSTVSTVTRGTSPVTSVQIANDGSNGAIKLTITYINNSGVVTGGQSTVTFVGQIA